MHLKEMRQIADARTKGEWFGNVRSFHAPGFIQMAATTPLITADDRMTSDQAHLDGEFIAMAANNWDVLIAEIEQLRLNNAELINAHSVHIDDLLLAMRNNEKLRKERQSLIAVVDAAIGLSERSFPRHDESDDYSYIEVTTGDTAALKTALKELEK